MVEVEQRVAGRGCAQEPDLQSADGVALRVLGHPVQVQGLLVAAFAPVALDPHIQRQHMEGRPLRCGGGRPLHEVDRFGEGAAGLARVHELEHPVVRLTVVRIALVRLRQQAPGAGEEHGPRRVQPVLLQPLALVQLGEGQQAHPRHRVGGRGVGGRPAGLPGLLPQLLCAAVTVAVRPDGPLHDDPGVHHGGRDAAGLLGQPGLYRVRARGDGSEHLGALGPQGPVRGALQQITHGEPASRP